MQIRQLAATKVHGYLPINIEFFPDLTFLTGLNGSGKTSALRLLMALLTPNLEELGRIDYSEAVLKVEDDKKILTIKATRTPKGVELRLSPAFSDSLKISSAELELLQDAKRRDEPRSPIIDKYLADPIFKALQALSTPMFLGLDRRFFAPGQTNEDPVELRRRDYLARRYWSEDPSYRIPIDASLLDVNYLVVTRMQEIRTKQEKLDEQLRKQFFAKAFEYNPGWPGANQDRRPSSAELEKYRKQLEKIELAAGGVKIPVPEIQAALTKFFERMSQVVESLNKDNNLNKKTKSSREPELLMNQDYFEWIINKPQADRIVEHLGLLEGYIEARAAIHDPITRFLELLNTFFSQTRKRFEVAATGGLAVFVEGSQQAKPISALSSGERQLLIMLAHLSLNPNLTGSGIFIVDEPELSLHIYWQERLVEAIQAANPKVQLILATHSPAIVLDRVDSCRSLDRV